jgi:NAD(P)-dependent dehydrogenase (short-subunit alcohol dehydrogenase family)
MTDIRLDGKVAIITGATGGWGSGSAMALAARGAAVVLNSRTQAKLDALANRLTQKGFKAIGVAQDVRTYDGAQYLVERAVQQFGRLDILMHSAGVVAADAVANNVTTADALTSIYGGTLLQMTPESWDLVLSAELTSVFTCAKAAATQMVAQDEGGAIIAVVGTILGAAGQSAHAVAKAGLLNALWSWSDELKPHGITVNGVRGYVRSLLTDKSFDVEGFDFDAPRVGPELPTEPREAGELIAWLASADAAEVTGAYVGLDGPRVTYWEPKLPEMALFRYPQWTAEELGRTFGPIIRRRSPRPSMTDVVRDLFSADDLARAEQQRSRQAEKAN